MACFETASHICSPPTSVRRQVGLRNLNNTCYLNAAVQCLVHTPFLAAYFGEQTYVRDINYGNVLGSQGLLAIAFAKLLDRIWSNLSLSVSPADLKTEIEKFAGQFKGDDQHDSQELLSSLLDGLHEDLNQASAQTPPSPAPEGLPEQELADVLWEQHFKRNCSVISREMHGQYRSQVTCLKCRKASVKFEPFLMVSVEIPPPPTRYEVRLVPGQFDLPTRAFAFLFSGEVLALQLKAKLAEALSNPAVDLVLCELDKETQSLWPLPDFTRLQAKRIYFAYQIDPEMADSCIPVLISLLKEDRSAGYSKPQLVTSPRLLLLQGNSSLEETHVRVFEAVRPVVRLGWGKEGNRMDIDAAGENETEQTYKRLYEEKAKYGSKPNSLYSLRVVNYNRHWNYCRPGSEACPYCQSVHFHSCFFPCTATSLHDYTRSQDSNHYLHLEATCPQGLFDPQFWMREERDATVEVSEQVLEEDRDRAVTLEECLGFTCMERSLGQEDKWVCPLCREEVDSSKRMTLYRLPHTLVIHLKRFQESVCFPTKADKLVDFPLLSLNLSAFSDQPSPPVYDLYAVIDHCGSLSYGHYTAQCKSGEDWVCFDDEQVAVVREAQAVVTQRAYVLFYQARK